MPSIRRSVRQRLLPTTIVLALLLGPPAPIAANPADAAFKGAVANYERGDRAASLETIRSLASKGHVEAQMWLGNAYGRGVGGARPDWVESLKWYRLAATAGNVEAQNTLGSIYSVGLGVRRDDAEAAKWLRLAADRGYPPAQSALSLLYHAGRGVPQDYAQAVRLGEMAAAQGHWATQANLARVYERGPNGTQDLVQALKWLEIALTQMSDRDVGPRQMVARDRDRVLAMMGTGQIIEARNQVRAWQARQGSRPR
jgi:TPR repeat protein